MMNNSEADTLTELSCESEEIGRILVVEDNRINRILITTILDDYNVSHETAGSGQEALEIMREQKFDLVLMDIKMPGMDGIETTRKIRAMETPQQIGTCCCVDLLRYD